MQPNDSTDVRGLLEQIRAQLADLAGRVAKLEGGGVPKAPAVPLPAEAAPVQPSAVPPRPAPDEGVSEETLLAISACVAAFLGERVHIRSIRLLSSPAWAQQGRVSVQASHRLH
jgi:methylmalonyl-CoA carboxyltransferase large subunit